MSIRIISSGSIEGQTRLAVVRLQMRPNLRKVDEPVDLAKQVIVRDMPFEAEAVEQRLLHHPPFAHHRPISSPSRENQRRRRDQASFSTQFVDSSRPLRARSGRSAAAWRTGQVGPKGTSVAIVDTTCALTAEFLDPFRANRSSVPNTKLGERAPNERHIIAVPDRERRGLHARNLRLLTRHHHPPARILIGSL